MRLVVPDKFVKFRDPHLKLSGEMRPKAVSGDIFDSVFAITSDWKYSNVISGVAVECVGNGCPCKIW